MMQGEEIFQLLPQRPPIVMIDKFYGVEEEKSFSGLTVTAENLFCQNGMLQETGVIEHIAQSAAARVGYIALLEKAPVPLGFIGSVDKMKIHQLPVVGSELKTEITVMQEVGDITLISAQVKSEDTLIAEGRMKIFLKKE
ncbi:hydroxymyristoyl-ACP dehydratase [Bacteroides sp. 51]|uniref:hydroxymyristoyl-ACP dehydratase n=1 Tax=Bacteroides sp. 51 TaxID=2302938 RepID=UPI0013CFF3AB|nr:hydroxymyristoyl-ACP dehydratase [Bacteroides sp. 51]NDV81062.1 hydroxymyristoyl-ACP dehydratase [Bacteroides sp. 51]